MPKVHLTIEVDNLREVGEVIQDFSDSGWGSSVSNVEVDVNDDGGSELTIEEVLEERRWDILDEDGEFIKTVATDQIIQGDW